MKFEFAIYIPAPREFVWSVAQDPVYRQRWDPRVARYTIYGEAGSGTPVSIVVRAFLLRYRVDARLTFFDPPLQSILRIEHSTSGLFSGGGGTWLFEEIGEGTRFTTRFNLKYKSRFPTFDRLIRWGVSWDTRRSLKNLRKLVVKLYSEDQRKVDMIRRPATMSAISAPEK